MSCTSRAAGQQAGDQRLLHGRRIGAVVVADDEALLARRARRPAWRCPRPMALSPIRLISCGKQPARVVLAKARRLDQRQALEIGRVGLQDRRAAWAAWHGPPGKACTQIGQQVQTPAPGQSIMRPSASRRTARRPATSTPAAPACRRACRRAAAGSGTTCRAAMVPSLPALHHGGRHVAHGDVADADAVERDRGDAGHAVGGADALGEVAVAQ